MWSFSFIIVDIAVNFIPPMSVAFYRFIVASIWFLIMDFLKIIRRYAKNSEQNSNQSQDKYTKREWILIFFSSFTGVSLFFFSQYNAINLIGPSLPALFVCLLSPVLIAIFALIFFAEKLNKYKIIGFIIASIGGFLLVTGGDIMVLAPDSPNFYGYLFALITPFFWAVYSTMTKQIKNKSSLEMLKYLCYFGTIELFLIILATGELPIFLNNVLNLILILCALYLGLGCYVIGYYIWQSSQRKMESSKVASFLYIEPFLTLFFSFILQRDEVIVIWNIIGGIIVLIAVLIINYEKTTKDQFKKAFK
jgi:drug/metabolite transporter (DMT)-like permease